MAEVDLHALSRTDLSAILGLDPVVALIGSGASIWEPTALPSGWDFSQGTFSALFQTAGMPVLSSADEQWIEDWFLGKHARLTPMPFEVLMERCPRQDTLGTLLNTLYLEDRANPVHECVARVAAAGHIHSIITTNYDCGLDTALRTAAAGLARVVRSHDSKSGRLYFKIHGTAEAGAEDTLVYRLRAEGALPDWKRTALQGVVRDRVLLIIGYSGVDFDICPEIPAASPRLVVWAFRSGDDMRRSPGWGRLQEQGVRCVALIGDMLRLLELLNAPVSAVRATGAVDVARELRSRFSVPELVLWRARVLNSLGHARLAADALGGLPPGTVTEFDENKERGQASFHAGAYKFSVTLFLKAARAAVEERSRRLALLDASDAARCHGDLRRAEELINASVDGASADEPWHEEVASVRDVKLILVHRDRYEVAGVLRRSADRHRLRASAEPLFERATRSALVSGRLYEFQQLALWAERMSIDRSRLLPHGLYGPSAAEHGYRQLGFPVGLAMAACDRARDGQTVRADLEYFLDLMETIGCAPQAWKVAYALVRRHPTSVVKSFAPLIRNFRRCEYAWPAWLAWLLRGS